MFEEYLKKRDIKKNQIVLVTGSSGFLGQHVVRLLQEKDGNVREIRGYDLVPYQNHLKHKTPKEMKVFVGDICDRKKLSEALAGVDAVIHCAALVDIEPTADPAKLQKVNVQGTQTLIDACVEANVGHLIHVSGTEVLIRKTPLCNIQENSPPPPRGPLLLGPYAQSKADSEVVVKKADGRQLANKVGQLRTLILRPTYIYGEGDKYFVTKALKIAKECNGVLQKVDNTFVRFHPVYVGNAAHACLVAKDRIQNFEPNEKVAGEEYFVTDNTRVWDPFEFFENFLKPCGYRLSDNSYSLNFFLFIMTVVGFLSKFGINLVRFPSEVNSRLVRLICMPFFFNRNKIIYRLDYEPLFEPEESLKASIPYYQQIFGK